eukprot:TRINITY_DN7085_c1_g1_i3.p1 TRINITY_DN7085_c1_g1~~TRINITY_DN7085_c1_g1_i3.p1  ORF type:complete len:223 (-),score=44.87 TRINITY_DN7085_c1_g1_i3:164-832(-)
MIPLIPVPMAVPSRQAGVNQAIAQALASMPPGQILCGTDGGSSKKCRGGWVTQRAGWGVAFGQQSFGGVVPGYDQVALAAETWALITLLRAAGQVQRSLLVIIDNSTVVCRSKAVLRGDHVPSEAPQAWVHIRHLLVLTGSLVEWVPAHDKHPEWAPPVAGHSPEEWRRLSDGADKQASEYGKQSLQRHAAPIAGQDAALKWAAAALKQHFQAMKALSAFVH